MSTLDKVLFFLAIVVIAVVGYFVWQNNQQSPRCLINNAKCPVEEDWKTFTDNTQKIAFQYPEKLSTTYITAQTWPPVVKIASGISECSVEPFIIDGLSYCVSAQTDGAAGSVYTTYNYAVALPKLDKTIEVNFTLQSVQCANYDDPQKTACDTERTSFNVDGLVSQIISTIRTI